MLKSLRLVTRSRRPADALPATPLLSGTDDETYVSLDDGLKITFLLNPPKLIFFPGGGAATCPRTGLQIYL